MIKIITKLLMIGLVLGNALALESMGVEGPIRLADEKLIAAAQNGNLAVAQAALKSGANINYVGLSGGTALGRAAYYGHIDMAQFLIEHGANIDQANKSGYTALMEAVRGERTDIVRMLINAGAHVNHVDNDGDTALMWAAELGRIDMARLLIEHGADINHTDDNGDTALISNLISMTRLRPLFHPQILATARLLIEHGAGIPIKEELQRVAQRYPKYPDLIKNAIRALTNVFEGNLLAYAAARGDTKHVVELLSTLPQAQPLTINHQDSHGMTALHWAAAQGHDDIVKLLLDLGANIDLQNVQGNTPLHLAARNGNLSTVQLLLVRGANATLANANGQTPLALAHQYHHPDVVAFLEGEAGRVVFGRISRAGRGGGFAWQPAGQQHLPPEIAQQIAQLAQAHAHPMLPSGSPS